MKKKILDGIVGARPNLMKMAPLARALAKDDTFELRLIHTGQHYDDQMSEVFFREFGLSAPAFNLRVGSGSQAVQTARILEGYERLLIENGNPAGVIVLGDVTSTMACTLVAAKMGIAVAHVEAGLRSYDKSMPEEINRIVTDAIAELLFVSDPSGLHSLGHEGHDWRKIHYVGNLMIDTLLSELPTAEHSSILESCGVKPGAYVYMTLHRPSNVDDPQVLRCLIDAILLIASECPVVFAVHPRTQRNLGNLNLNVEHRSLRLIEPLGYRDNIKMIKYAKAVLTDSGGIQEEASVLDVPCITLRFNTERPVTIDFGTCELVGNDPAKILEAWCRVKANAWKKAGKIPLWDGLTGERIAIVLREQWGMAGLGLSNGL